MPSRNQFNDHVANSLSHLYDLVRLRNDPLGDWLITHTEVGAKDRGWKLQELLTKAIEDLDPGPDAPIFSKAWRRHRLMLLRYVEAQPPQAVADALAISRRQFYREHAEALVAIADALWSLAQPQVLAAADKPGEASQIELLRLEAARIGQAGKLIELESLVVETVALLREMLHQRQNNIVVETLREDVAVPVDRSLLRQLLLSMISLMLDETINTTLHIEIRPINGSVEMQLWTGASDVRANLKFADSLRVAEELAAACNAVIRTDRCEGKGQRLTISLPRSRQATILIVDDNEDVLALYERYLSAHAYRTVTVASGQNVYHLARDLQPHVVLLDLMMPETDGWDVLQTLTHQPDTAHIPVVVCSILQQRELALSLGAAEFLQKPLTEQRLIETLETLKRDT